MSDDDIKSVLALVAITLSAASLLFARKSWQQSNRPIVTAFVTDHEMGNLASTFDLVLSNTGNRPAVNVRLHAKSNHLPKLLEATSSQDHLERMASIFSDNSRISVLRDGEELRTSFGACTPNETKEWLKYGAEIPIEITYSDLAGKRYKSKLPLRIRVREGFGGGVWRSGKKRA